MSPPARSPRLGARTSAPPPAESLQAGPGQQQGGGHRNLLGQVGFRVGAPAPPCHTCTRFWLSLGITALCLSPAGAEPAYDLKQVLNVRSVCSQAQFREALQRDGFVILRDGPRKSETPKEQGRPDVANAHWRHFFEVYESLRYDDHPAFITTDVALHYAHEVVDFTLEQVESKSLFDCVQGMQLTLIKATQEQLRGSSDASLQSAARSNLALLSVAYGLLDPRWKPEAAVAAQVAAEQARILKAGGLAHSDVLGYDEDYSQYKPRGHYTRSDRLKRYFRAVMWLGRAELAPDCCRPRC